MGNCDICNEDIISSKGICIDCTDKATTLGLRILLREKEQKDQQNEEAEKIRKRWEEKMDENERKTKLQNEFGKAGARPPEGMD